MLDVGLIIPIQSIASRCLCGEAFSLSRCRVGRRYVLAVQMLAKSFPDLTPMHVTIVCCGTCHCAQHH